MLKRCVGDPDEDVAMLTERSPITYVGSDPGAGDGVTGRQ